MKKVGIYLRVSTEEQARIQDGSLVSQRRRLEDYVESQNKKERSWGIVTDVYCDEGRSAKDMNRPEFQRLLSDIRAGKVNLILATELSRLSRSTKDFCELWDFLKKHGASFVTLRDQYDTTTAAGELMVFNMINFAQFERKQTGERISANFKSRAARGLWNGGVIPLGYHREEQNPGKLLIHPKESKSVKLIFETFLQTGNLRETCLKLNQQGLRTKAYVNRKGERVGGNHFTVPSLHHLLTNASFIGMREINKTKGERELVKAQWEPIIEKSVFQAVQKKLKKNRRKYKPDHWKTYPYPLTGIAVCGECGKTLNGKSAHGKTQKHHYYDHPRTLKGNGKGHIHKCQIQRLRAERVETVTLKLLKLVLSEPNRIKEAVAIYQKQKNKAMPHLELRLKSVLEDLHGTEKRQNNLIARISELPAEVSAEPFYKQLTDIQNKLVETAKLKADLESQKLAQASDVSAPEIEQRIKRTVYQLEKTPPEHQRALFENVIQFAEFHPTLIRLGIFSATVGSPTLSNGGD